MTEETQNTKIEMQPNENETKMIPDQEDHNLNDAGTEPDLTSSSNTGSGPTSWLGRPENLGNQAGQTIEKTLSPVGTKLGSGLSYVVKPVGGVVDGVVGGVMRSGNAVGQAVGVKEADGSEVNEESQGKKEHEQGHEKKYI